MKRILRRSGFGRFLLILFVAWLASACQSEASHEDCELAGDEDDNGLADCGDPACAGTPTCQPRCGNGKLEAGEGCDDGNTTSGDGCDSNCMVTGCGNGIVTANEECDDTNSISGDGCDNNCKRTRCGNGVLTMNEGCDDGNAVEGDGCDSNCTITKCGNGIVTAGETCDDGNAVEGDGCDSNCTITECGNGIVTTGEVCDDGNRIDTDACTNACKRAVCGDGSVQAGVEECDDKNRIDTDACTNACKRAVCGDGSILAGVELCDDGNRIDTDACTNACLPARCGDRIIRAGVEQCDDGNFSNTDACTNACKLAVCGDRLIQTGVETCDDGNVISGDGCDANCTVTACGNGVVTGDEGCDDGNTSNTDACTSICEPAVCGDGIIQAGVEQCDASNGADVPGCNHDCTADVLAYIKASNTGGGDFFGYNIALSVDGSTLAVGAPFESSAATGSGGSQTDNSAWGAGAVYVFVRDGTAWSQQAYLKASNTGAKDQFGVSVALSADGSTLAVGANREDSAATGIDGEQADNSAADAGAVYVFARTGTTWSQQAYIKASNTDAGDHFGDSVALSTDGSTLAVGAPWEASVATGMGGDQTDNSNLGAGAVYVFARSGTTWSQQAYVKTSNTEWGGTYHFGESVALSAGDSTLTLAVGAPGEDSAATGIGGDQTDDSAPGAGAVYVFTRSGTAWSQQAYVKASNTEAGDHFGESVALSADGSTLGVGAPWEDSAAAGVDSDEDDNSAPEAGAVYTFARSGTTWSQQAYVKPSTTGAGDFFGERVALSADGSTLAMGARGESSAATGIGGDPTDNSAWASGAVCVFTRSGTSWGLPAYVKASNTGAFDSFGNSVALSGDGSILVVGANREDSAAVGIGGSQSDNSALDAGAVYVYH